MCNGVGAKELELAKTSLEVIEAPFAPEEFKDVYREELQAMIAKKMSDAGTAPTTHTPATTPLVVDIPEALKKRIVLARKPPAQETQPTRMTGGRVTEIKSKRQTRSFQEYPLVVEVRHASWITEEILDTFAALGLGLCNIDQAALPTGALVPVPPLLLEHYPELKDVAKATTGPYKNMAS